MPKLLTDRELGQLLRLHAKGFKAREPYYPDTPLIMVSDDEYHRENQYEVSKLFELIETIRA